jgi:hypothetical protein
MPWIEIKTCDGKVEYVIKQSELDHLSMRACPGCGETRAGVYDCSVEKNREGELLAKHGYCASCGSLLTVLND